MIPFPPRPRGLPLGLRGPQGNLVPPAMRPAFFGARPPPQRARPAGNSALHAAFAGVAGEEAFGGDAPRDEARPRQGNLPPIPSDSVADALRKLMPHRSAQALEPVVTWLGDHCHARTWSDLEGAATSAAEALAATADAASLSIGSRGIVLDLCKMLHRGTRKRTLAAMASMLMQAMAVKVKHRRFGRQPSRANVDLLPKLASAVCLFRKWPDWWRRQLRRSKEEERKRLHNTVR